jgi:uncharacterized membrane protein YidH (DUF202 family)
MRFKLSAKPTSRSDPRMFTAERTLFAWLLTGLPNVALGVLSSALLTGFGFRFGFIPGLLQPEVKSCTIIG